MWIKWATGAEQEEFERLLANDAFKEVKTMGTTWFEQGLERNPWKKWRSSFSAKRRLCRDATANRHRSLPGGERACLEMILNRRYPWKMGVESSSPTIRHHDDCA